MKILLTQITECRTCEKYLEFGPNPIIAASAKSAIIIIGQAPGRIVHETGIPWNDKSGDNLRKWLGVEKAKFYNTDYFALMPMGFCYPGKGKTGDLPPRQECAPLWHHKLQQEMKQAQASLNAKVDHAKNYDYLKVAQQQSKDSLGKASKSKDNLLISDKHEE